MAERFIVTNQLREFSITKPATSEEALAYCEQLDEVSVDTETTSLSCHTGEIIILQIGDKHKQFIIDTTTIDIQLFKELLENKLLVLQNAKFDLQFFYDVKIIPTKIYDTYLAEMILTCGELTIRRGLGHLIERYCAVQVDKSVVHQITRDGLTERVLQYCAEDIQYLPDIKEKQLKKIKAADLEIALDLDNAFVRVLAYIEYCGIFLDVEAWKKKMQGDKKAKDAQNQMLNEWVIKNMPNSKFINRQLDMFSTEIKTTVNWSSPKQTIEVMEVIGVNCNVNEKGKWKKSVDAKHLGGQKQTFPIIKEYLKFKEAEKLTGTYGQNFIDQINPKTGRIHTTFKQIMATGRLSSGGTDRATKTKFINFQNIPSDKTTRSCFIAEEGNMLAVADYSGMETVVMANLSEDPSLIEFFEGEDSDMHSFVARKIAEVSNIFPKEMVDCPTEMITDGPYKPQRQIAKSAGFAFLFGGNGSTIAKNLGMTEQEGNEIYTAYFDVFPGLKDYFAEQHAYTLKFGHVFFNEQTARKSYIPYFEDFQQVSEQVGIEGFWDVYKQEKAGNTGFFKRSLRPLVKEYFNKKGAIERKAQNYPIQGTSSDITKLAGVKFFNWILENDYFGVVKIPNIIHDRSICCV